MSNSHSEVKLNKYPCGACKMAEQWDDLIFNKLIFCKKYKELQPIDNLQCSNPHIYEFTENNNKRLNAIDEYQRTNRKEILNRHKKRVQPTRETRNDVSFPRLF